MNRKIIILASLLFFVSPINAGNSSSSISPLYDEEYENKKDEYNTFTLFTALPQEIQKVIMQYVWVVEDGDKEFNKACLSLPKNDKSLRKIPVKFYTYKDTKPFISEVGYIARDSHYKICLPGSSARISTPGEYSAIESCCLSVHGDIAIQWNTLREFHNYNDYNYDFYITFAHVDEIKKESVIDLDQNKLDLKLYNLKEKRDQSTLFNLKGTQLAIVGYDTVHSLFASTTKSKVDALIDAPSKDKQLKPEKILKRLMIAKEFPLTKAE